MQTVPRELRIQQIIVHAFEDLNGWTRPNVLEASIGPGYPEVFVSFERTLRRLREDIRRTLQNLDDAELDCGFPPSTTPSINPLFDRKGLFAAIARRFHLAKRDKPPNFVGGWAIKEASLEVGYWRTFQSYSLTQAALLCVGRDPRKTSFDQLMKQYGRSSEADELLYFLEDLYEALANGLGLDPKDGETTVNAQALLNWVNIKTVKIDPRFRRMLKVYHPVSSGPTVPPQGLKAREDKRLHGSTFTAHARILGAVAIAKYRLDGVSSIGRVAREMVNDGNLNGLRFDAKVVRGLLRSALDQLAEEKPF